MSEVSVEQFEQMLEESIKSIILFGVEAPAVIPTLSVD